MTPVIDLSGGLHRWRRRTPCFQSFRSSVGFMTFVVSFAVFIDQFFYGSILPILPYSLTERLDVGSDKIQYWSSVFVAIYGAISCVISPPWGWFSDRTKSRNAPFLFGLLTLIGANIIIWLARTIWLAIIGRLLLGFSSTVVWITGFALLVDTVGQKNIGKAMGFVTIGLNAGSLIGPLLGGVVFDRAGYDAVFWMLIALIALDIAFRMAAIERKVIPDLVDNEAPEPTNIESKVTATSDSRELWPSSEKSSQTAPVRKIPTIIKLLASKRLLVALWGTWVQAGITSGVGTVLPNFVHLTFKWNSIGAGLIFLPIAIPALCGPLIGWFADRFGPRWPTTIGFIMLCPVMVLLAEVRKNAVADKVILCVLLALLGIGHQLAVAPLMAEMAYAVEAEKKQSPERFGAKSAYAQAYALFTMAWSAGNAIGPIWAGMVYDAAGWATMGWTLGLLAAVSAIPIALFCGGWILHGKKDLVPEEDVM